MRKTPRLGQLISGCADSIGRFGGRGLASLVAAALKVRESAGPSQVHISQMLSLTLQCPLGAKEIRQNLAAGFSKHSTSDKTLVIHAVIC